jgi:hypothetical protein
LLDLVLVIYVMFVLERNFSVVILMHLGTIICLDYIIDNLTWSVIKTAYKPIF